MAHSTETKLALLEMQLARVETEVDRLKAIVRTNETLAKNAVAVFRIVSLGLSIIMPVLGALATKYFKIL